MTIAQTIRRLRPWKPPTIEAPYPIDASELRSLGTDKRGRVWWSHPLGELMERPRPMTEADILPNAPYAQERVGDERTYRVFSVNAPGSFAAFEASTVASRKPPAPSKPADALAYSGLADARSERIVAPPSRDTLALSSVRGGVYGGRPAVRGPEAILARLAERGSVVTLSADRAGLVVSAPGGRPAPGVTQLVALAHPLLLAHLQGTPLTCTVTKHKTPTPATTIAVGGAPWCGECTP